MKASWRKLSSKKSSALVGGTRRRGHWGGKDASGKGRLPLACHHDSGQTKYAQLYFYKRRRKLCLLDVTYECLRARHESDVIRLSRA
eukprot:354418-Amphidinium_carterae.1